MASVSQTSKKVGQARKSLYVLGRDISHTLSPVLYRAVFNALGLDWTYDSHEEQSEDSARAWLSERDFFAVNVTTPYKGLAKQEADLCHGTQDTQDFRSSQRAGKTLTQGRSAQTGDTSPSNRAENTSESHHQVHAAFTGVSSDAECVRFSADGLPGANLLINTAQGLAAFNTDGEGACAFLRHEGIELASQRFVVCGTGATSHSIARSLVRAGALDVHMLSRSSSAERISLYCQAQELIGQANVVVNATPVGMKSNDVLPFSDELLGAHQVVLDAVYGHGITPFKHAAIKRGCSFFDGCGMLIYQAIYSLRLVLLHANIACELSDEQLYRIMLTAIEGN